MSGQTEPTYADLRPAYLRPEEIEAQAARYRETYLRKTSPSYPERMPVRERVADLIARGLITSRELADALMEHFGYDPAELEPAHAAGTCPGCGSLNIPEAQRFTQPHEPAYHLIASSPPDAPEGAEPDDDPDALADELYRAIMDARHRDGDHWSDLLIGSAVYRGDLIARAHLTRDELAAAAARFGIVADGDALPLNTSRRSLVIVADEANPDPDTEAITRSRMRAEARDRMRELGEVWAGMIAWRPSAPGSDMPTQEARAYALSHDRFEEAQALAGRATLPNSAPSPAADWPILAALDWSPAPRVPTPGPEYRLRRADR